MSEGDVAGPMAPSRRRAREPAPGGAPAPRIRWLPEPTWRARLVFVAVAALGLVLAWRAFTIGMAEELADRDPDAAVAWRPDDAAAALDAAGRHVAAHEFETATTLARQTLADSPLQGHAYRVLADVDDFFGRPDAALRGYRTARRYAPRDMGTLGKLADYALRAGRVDEAFTDIGLLLRMFPEAMPQVVPGLVQLSKFPEAQAPLGNLLRSQPTWRASFLALLASAGEDPLAIDRVFALRGRDQPLPARPPQVILGGPPPVDSDGPTGFTEADLLIAREVDDGRWAAARARWIDTLSPGERTRLQLVYDGGFEYVPHQRHIDWLGLTTRAFGWQLPQSGTGFDSQIAPRAKLSPGNVLTVTFNGLPVDYAPVVQLLVLAPGHYRLTGMGQAGGMTREEGLRWVVACARSREQRSRQQSEQVLGQSNDFLGDIPYGAFAFDFTIPDKDCDAQLLRLDLGSGLYQGIPLQGGALFDDLTIASVDDPAPAKDAAPSAASGSAH